LFIGAIAGQTEGRSEKGNSCERVYWNLADLIAKVGGKVLNSEDPVNRAIGFHIVQQKRPYPVILTFATKAMALRFSVTEDISGPSKVEQWNKGRGYWGKPTC
jgi:hypothetical protein